MTAETGLLELISALLRTLAIVSAPVLAAVSVAGFLLAIVSASTGIQDPAVGQVVRLAAGAAALCLGGAWMAGVVVRFTVWIYSDFGRFLGVGV